MAHSARLNLRMQKELKLLLTDPPPGSSFPSLSAASSLTSIDALFQGPEGSVYADGVFNISIQIPERYPFQPPIVTFATPIYHPNIDNGGRICLDILNLPPKGTWQPSLNISTVLMSIRLLLIEPNPDDGLMHEASREYKYNRQAFDQNARSMTQKYAKAGESESAETSRGIQPHSRPHTTDRVMEAAVASIGHRVSDERSCESSRKLSLEILGSSSNGNHSNCKVSIHDCSTDDTLIQHHEEADRISSEHARNPRKIQATRNKLSLNDSDGQNVNHGYEIMHNKNKFTERSCYSSANQEHQSTCFSKIHSSWDLTAKLHRIPLNHSEQHEAMPLLGSGHNEKGPSNFTVSSTRLKLKKAGVTSSEPLVCSQERIENKKLKLDHVQSLPQPTDESAVFQRAGKQVVVPGSKPSEEQLVKHEHQQLLGCDNNVVLDNNMASSHGSKCVDARNDMQYLDQDSNEESSGEMEKGNEDPRTTEAVIVLDSEDSEDESVILRSKVSLGKRCLTRKKSSFYR